MSGADCINTGRYDRYDRYIDVASEGLWGYALAEDGQTALGLWGYALGPLRSPNDNLTPLIPKSSCML